MLNEVKNVIIQEVERDRENSDLIVALVHAVNNETQAIIDVGNEIARKIIRKLYDREMTIYDCFLNTISDFQDDCEWVEIVKLMKSV